jgi:phosphatidylserine/phosphatidylglycerophosphate/cardiolipin synthase-like enzyme
MGRCTCARYSRLGRFGLLTFLGGLLGLGLIAPAPGSSAAPLGVDACFTPDGKCIIAIVGEIAKARSTVRLQAYTFRSQAIADALLAAFKRGVKVEAIVDKSERSEGFPPAALLSVSGVPVFVDGRHATTRTHMIIVDGTTVITGSASFTGAIAETESADVVIIRSREIATMYDNSWKLHREHAEQF